MSVGWFLPSIGDALSLADFRRGCSLFCGQPWVLEAFASPSWDRWLAGRICSCGSEPGGSGLVNVRSVQSCSPVLIDPVPPI